MKFGYTFKEYLQVEREWLLDENCAHIEYNRLKNVLKSCKNCKSNTSSHDKDQLCQCQSCPGMSCFMLYVLLFFVFYYVGNELLESKVLFFLVVIK